MLPLGPSPRPPPVGPSELRSTVCSVAVLCLPISVYLCSYTQSVTYRTHTHTFAMDSPNGDLQRESGAQEVPTHPMGRGRGYSYHWAMLWAEIWRLSALCASKYVVFHPNGCTPKRTYVCMCVRDGRTPTRRVSLGTPGWCGGGRDRTRA